MPRPSADLPPISVHFGDVIETPNMSKISVVVELYSDTSIYVAGVLNDLPGKEVLSSMGTAGREDVTKVIGRWDLATIQAAFSRNSLIAETSDSFKQQFKAHLESESQKPPILLRR